jgi:hypothetical protein
MDMMELLTETQQKDLSNAIWIKEVLEVSSGNPEKSLPDTIKMTTRGLEIGSDEKVIMIDLTNYGGKFPIPIHKIYGRLLIKGYIGKIEDLNFSPRISAITHSVLYHENPLDSENHPCVEYINDVTYINDWKWHIGEDPILGSRVRFMDSEYKKIFDESHEDFDMIWNTMKDQRDLICQTIGIDVKTVELIVNSRRISNF